MHVWIGTDWNHLTAQNAAKQSHIVKSDIVEASSEDEFCT